MFSNITDVWNNDPVKEISKKISSGLFNHPNCNNEYQLLQKAKQEESNDKIDRKNNYYYLDDNDTYSISVASDYKSKYKTKTQLQCHESINHIVECKECYEKLQKKIVNRFDKKLDKIFLKNKLKKIQKSSYKKSQIWKNISVIVIGILIILLFLFLIIKSINN